MTPWDRFMRDLNIVLAFATVGLVVMLVTVLTGQ